MNYLQLCQFTRRKCMGENSSSNTPTAVTGQSGNLAKIVADVAEAWRFLQRMHPDWKFLRAQKNHTLTIGTRAYSIASAVAPGMGIASIREFNKNLLLIEEVSTDKCQLDYQEWEDFNARIISSSPGRPTVMTENLSGEVEFDMTPDKAYVARLPYWTKAITLAADADTPVIDDDLHEVIGYQAVMIWAAEDTAGELYMHAKMQRDRLLRQLETQYLPLPTSSGHHPPVGI